MSSGRFCNIQCSFYYTVLLSHIYMMMNFNTVKLWLGKLFSLFCFCQYFLFQNAILLLLHIIRCWYQISFIMWWACHIILITYDVYTTSSLWWVYHITFIMYDEHTTSALLHMMNIPHHLYYASWAYHIILVTYEHTTSFFLYMSIPHHLYYIWWAYNIILIKYDEHTTSLLLHWWHTTSPSLHMTSIPDLLHYIWQAYQTSLTTYEEPTNLSHIL